MSDQQIMGMGFVGKVIAVFAACIVTVVGCWWGVAESEIISIPTPIDYFHHSCPMKCLNCGSGLIHYRKGTFPREYKCGKCGKSIYYPL